MASKNSQNSKTGDKIAFKTKVAHTKAGFLLIDYLCDRFHYHSREKWLENIQAGEIELNGHSVQADQCLKTGDEITYVTTKRQEPKVPKKIDVLFEDTDLLIVNKPAHLPVHPGGRYLNNTLISLLKSKKKKDSTLFLSHRLDRETSGICVLSKTPLAKEKMYWKFFNSEVEKTYWALVWGDPKPKSGRIDSPIGAAFKKGQPPLSRIRIKQVVRGYDSKKAITKYRTLSTQWLKNASWTPPPWPDIEKIQDSTWPVSLVECEPLTGRTNQIRVHLASLGHGIVGDKLYDLSEDIFLSMTEQKPILDGESEPAGPKLSPALRARMIIDSQALHARALKFRHPRHNRWVEIEAPVPKSWKGLYKSP